MDPSLFRIPAYELDVLWRYFDGVARAVTCRFDLGSPPNEENLTFLLCELLDDGMTARHVLELPLEKVHEQLTRSDGGISVSLRFQTHEHTKATEHGFSGADLGVVFVIERPKLPPIERAILLQAKKLFANTKNVYRASSTFKHFDAAQFRFLATIEKRFDVRNSIYYLWYTPSSTAFHEDDGNLLRYLEASHDRSGVPAVIVNPENETFVWIGDRPEPAGSRDDTREELARRWRSTQPGTRISSLDAVRKAIANAMPPSLLSLYEVRAAVPWRSLAFAPFADLLIAGAIGGGIGSSSPHWVRLARGGKVPLPPASGIPSQPQDEESPGDLSSVDLPELTPSVRHTVTMTVRSSVRWPNRDRDA